MTASGIEGMANTEQSLLAQALKLQKQGSFDLAILAFRKLLDTNPNNVEGHFNLGVVYEATGDAESAFYAYQAAATADPSYVRAHNNMAVLLEGQGRFDDAIAVYRQALEIKPEYGSAQANLCNALQRTNSFEEAAAAGRLAVQHSPKLPRAHNNLGTALLRLKQYSRAEDCFRKALTLEPHMKLAMGNLAASLELQDRFNEAKLCFEKTLKRYPDYIRAQLNYAWLSICLADWNASVQASTRALTLLSQQDAPIKIQPSVRPKAILKSDACLEALLCLQSVLRKHGIEIFLVFGTLLGCIRDGDFISYDTDIDVGVDGDADILGAIGELQDNGFEFRHRYNRNEPVTEDEILAKTVNFPFYYKNGVVIDVYRHFRQGDKVISGFELGGVPLWYENTPFRIEDHDFLGKPFKIPVDSDRYLTECYGDWREPDSNFETSLCSPNLVGGFPDSARALGYYRIVKLLQDEKFEKGLQLLHILASKDPSMEVASAIRKMQRRIAD